MSSKKIVVIDTETNWNDKVMSIGAAIADSESWKLIGTRYYILTPECNRGGMFSDVMEISGVKADLKASRSNVLNDLKRVLKSNDISSIFAYNAVFDYKHLPELSEYKWYDIMKIAAYKQFNKAISPQAECCGTGKLKRDYGVEPIMRLLSGNKSYFEVHNALCDAVDELKIVQLLGQKFEIYKNAEIN